MKVNIVFAVNICNRLKLKICYEHDIYKRIITLITELLDYLESMTLGLRTNNNSSLFSPAN